MNSTEFKFESWTVQIQRKAFHRGMKVTLSMDGPILVKVGLLTRQTDIESFLETKKSWLEKHLHKYEKLRNEIPKPCLKQGQLFPFQGRSLVLTCVLTLNKKPFFSIHENQLLMHVPKAQWSANSREAIYPWSDLLTEFYKKESQAWINKRVFFWSEQMKLRPSRVQFRAPKTRWGSCSSRGSLSFNWKLIVFERSVIDYVIIHELAHLKYMNHSGVFWSLVEEHCSDFQIQEKKLKDKHWDSYFLNSGKRL